MLSSSFPPRFPHAPSLFLIVKGKCFDEEPAEEVEAVDPVEVAAEVAEAVAEAALPAASRKAVYEAMKAGKSVEDAIVAQKELIESLKATLVESAPAATVEEAVVIPTVEKAESFRDVLNIKVG